MTGIQGAHTIRFIELCAIVLGVVWLSVNLYMIYPLLRGLVSSRRRGTPERENELGREQSTRRERAERPVPDGGLGESGSGSRGPDVPTIDLLIPAYDEADVIRETIRHVVNAPYPSTALNVTVLVEPDDDATREALAELRGRYTFTEIVVPRAYPGEANKPRALNYGFEVTAGDIVGVIDAEDIVDPTLFRTVSAAIGDRGRDYVQGRLDMANEGDGWLNTMFRGEYGVWYRLFLDGCRAARYPVPLGGSTNFFRRSVLAEISDMRRTRSGVPWSDHERRWLATRGLAGTVPWDPENVTEDFELGLFLWREGYDLEFLDLVTREESPLSVGEWLRQRTRWQKGKVYTFRQYLKNPPGGLRTAGHSFAQAVLPHLGLLNTIGVIVVFLLATAVDYDPPPAVGALLLGGLAFVVVQMLLQAAGYRVATETTGWTRARRTAVCFLTLPCYWLLQWAADIRALRQIYLGDLGWEKTDHNGQHGLATDGGRIADHETW